MFLASWIVGFILCLIGGVVGWLLGINGFSQPATPTPLGQSPRVKNLLWLFSGFLPLLLVDFKRIGIPATFPLYWPAGGYAVGAFAGAIGSIAWMAHSIGKSVKTFNGNHPGEPMDGHAIIREYFTFGKTRCDELFSRRKSEIEQSARMKNLAAERAAGGSQALCVIAVLGYLNKSNQEKINDRITAIQSILNSISSFVEAKPSKNVTISASYMAYTSTNDAINLVERAMFVRDMPDNYHGFLSLEVGGGVELQPVVLPVAADADCVLPGAPEAVSRLGAAIMNLNSLSFRSGVSATVRKEITDYFKRDYFNNIASVTSIVIFTGNSIKGIVNIESSEPNLLGTDDAAADATIVGLQTLVALLSIF